MPTPKVDLNSLRDRMIASLTEDEFTKDILDDFMKLNKESIGELIDLIISDWDEVPAINNLIRIRESLSVISDNKLLLISIRSILVASAS